MTGTWRRLPAIALACTIIALAVLAGCGGSDEDPLAAWADNFCTYVADWKSAIDGVGEDLTAGTAPTRETLDEAFGAAATATTDFADALRELGAPPVEAATQIEAVIEQLGTQIDGALTLAEEDLAAAPSGGAGVLAAVSIVSDALATVSGAFDVALGQLQDLDRSGEVSDALNESETCQEIAA